MEDSRAHELEMRCDHSDIVWLEEDKVLEEFIADSERCKDFW